MRRDFQLPPEDENYLNSLGLPWESVTEAGNWVIIHELPLPQGYTVEKTSVAIQVPAGYPTVELDMAFFHPAVTRADGRVIGAADVYMQFDGKQWQRWSRHRTGANPWVPDEDNLEAHMVIVSDWLAREFEQRAA